MIDSKKIKQMVEHVARRSRGVEDRELMYPMREWALGMAIATAVVLVGALVSYHFYSEAIDLAGTRVTPVAPDVPYDAQKISDAIHKYQDKDKIYQSIVNNTEVTPPVVPAVQNEVEEESDVSDEAVVPEEIVEDSIAPEETAAEGDVVPEVIDEGGLRAQ